MVEKKKTIKAAKAVKAVKKTVKVKPKKAEKAEELVIAKEEKLVEKAKEKIVEVISKADSSRKYFYAVGKRKSAVAQVKIYSVNEKDAKFLVNGKEMEKYFSVLRFVGMAKESLVATGKEKEFEVQAVVRGSGISSQAGAVRLGIARALIKSDENLRKSLKAQGLLTRDSREVERKKPGLRKARRGPQWAKR